MNEIINKEKSRAASEKIVELLRKEDLNIMNNIAALFGAVLMIMDTIAVQNKLEIDTQVKIIDLFCNSLKEYCLKKKE